ncbi:unnamed protein product [Absidia cylindrospora]
MVEIIQDSNGKELFYEFFSKRPSEVSQQRTTDNDLSTTSVSGKRLSVKDKSEIGMIYNGLDESKMWTLSTGKKVETTMKLLALQCDFEHRCHSLLLDPEDTALDDYFITEELKEITTHNAPTLPSTPSELDDYLKFLQQAKTAKNNKRNIDSINKKVRAMDGYKVDIIYRSRGVEAGREQGMDKSTKEIDDGHLKQPKVMKNMLCELVKKKPGLAGKLCIVGFTVMGTKINMLLLDAPSSGYVVRTTRTEPINTLEFADNMRKLLTFAFTGRLLLEHNYRTYSSYKSPTSSNIININYRHTEPSPLLAYSFYPSSSSSSPSSSCSNKSKR